MAPETHKRRTWYLNERQELSPFKPEGGGRPAKYVPIDWSARADGLAQSFRQATAAAPKDPTSERHRYAVVVPAAEVRKESTAKKAKDGVIEESVRLGGADSLLLRRLGMDHIGTAADGRAVVHIAARDLPRISATLTALPGAGAREKGRWIRLTGFEPVGIARKVDEAWLRALPPDVPADVIIRFQPLLDRGEVQDLARRVATRAAELGHTTTFRRSGRTLSGSFWIMGPMTPQAIRATATDFDAIQLIHAPMRTPFAGLSGTRTMSDVAGWASSNFPEIKSIDELPSVGVLDSGIPANHGWLGPYRRAGFRSDLRSVGDHGSSVASCVVFGSLPTSGPTKSGACRVVDVNVGEGGDAIDDLVVVEALQTVADTDPETRVFNLSFGTRTSLATMTERAREPALYQLQDLDNHAFLRDVVLVIAAGNSPPGLEPNQPYPKHVDDPRWGLGAYASSFNGIVCGAFVYAPNEGGIAQAPWSPSPFSRVGPGLARSPVPGFSGPGGDSSHQYGPMMGSGVGVMARNGLWEDICGTSVAAPLIAREAAWACRELAHRCPAGAQPFAGTVKAWLHLCADRPRLRGGLEKLAARTLGAGFPRVERLWNPTENAAVLVWQTVLAEPGTANRVQFPVPIAWLAKAEKPWLRVVAAWNTPVNIALSEKWGCRKVSVRVRKRGGEDALTGGGQASGSYPLVERKWALAVDEGADDAMWVLEVEYEEVGEYPIGMAVPADQRVGVVIELRDDGTMPASPHPFLASLPIAAEMDRLSVGVAPVAVPVRLRT